LDDARTALDRALQGAGYRPHWEALGEEAKLPERAALFVLGEQVGDRTGLELLLTVRATEGLSKTPVLLFGPARHTAMLAAWQAGADAYLTDPTSPDVMDLLRKLLAAAGS
jgi:DNA-binding response OmpR family regulator